jgi:hypothetical protein
MRKKWIFIVPAALLGIALFIFIGGEIVRQLWNWLLPALFGWPQITFWQALGVLVLCRVLFGGCGFRGSRSSNSSVRRRVADRMADRMADRFAERWEHMAPEERDRFRQRMRERFGFDPTAGESKG